MATRTTTRRPSRRRTSRTAAAALPYRPYHHRGETFFLIATALFGMVMVMLPLGVFWELFVSLLFFLVIPVTVLHDYWPKLKLEQLGWRSPEHPRIPNLYSALVIGLSFLPLILFLVVSDPARYAGVSPTIPWLPWLIGESIVVILILSQAAFYTGLLLFRLTHLLKPWQAISIVAVLLAIGQLVVPGTIRYFALPLTLSLAWMAWQTKSFVPVAVTQILLTLVFDLMVRLTT